MSCFALFGISTKRLLKSLSTYRGEKLWRATMGRTCGGQGGGDNIFIARTAYVAE
jgi:hypothetical protein